MLPDGELADNIMCGWHAKIQPPATVCNHETVNVDTLLQLRQQIF